MKAFHQFIHVEKGIKNSAIVNFLTGDIYQVANEIINKFNNKKYEDIKDFIDWAEKENLIIEIEGSTWVPSILLNELVIDQSIELEIEEGIDINYIKNFINSVEISRVIYYGENDNIKRKIERDFPYLNIFCRNKNPKKCEELVKVYGQFDPISVESYKFNMIYNSCWGKKIAINKKGEVLPCIYSQFSVGKLSKISLSRLMEKIHFYWELNKSKVEKCKYCEFRYVCFDCREIAYRIYGSIYATNPYCNYNP